MHNDNDGPPKMLIGVEGDRNNTRFGIMRGRIV